VLCDGQEQAEQLGYSPLPMNLVQAGAAQIERIPGKDASGTLDINACRNPTFKPGDSLSSNQLAATAPQPQACDRQGPDQCVTGTAGAKGDTPVSGSGAGGSSAEAGATGAAGGAGAAGTAGATSASGSDPIYDANGNLVSGSPLGGAVAASSPFTLGVPPWGPPQYGMVIGAVLLVVAIAVPPVLLRRRAGSTPRRSR
jgi:phosphate transport system substrate-binding protein